MNNVPCIILCALTGASRIFAANDIQGILNEEARPYAKTGNYKMAFQGYDKVLRMVSVNLPDSHPQKKEALAQVFGEKYSYAYICAKKMVDQQSYVIGGVAVPEILEIFKGSMDEQGRVPSAAELEIRRIRPDMKVVAFSDNITREKLLAIVKPEKSINENDSIFSHVLTNEEYAWFEVLRDYCSNTKEPVKMRRERAIEIGRKVHAKGGKKAVQKMLQSLREVAGKAKATKEIEMWWSNLGEIEE
jgi:hypothetical protein